MSKFGNKITLIGCGRLGLCTALCLENKGYDVLAVDVVESYVDQLNKRTFKSNEPRVEELLGTCKNFRATTNLDEGLAFSDMLWVLVDTPTAVGDQAYDHTKLSRVLSTLNKRQIANKHVIIVCTVMPGYIAQTGRYLIRDCPGTTLSYNPEFIAQGDIVRGFFRPDMVLIGEGSKEAGDWLEEIYRKTVETDPHYARMSPESAEITKLSVNCFVTTKISFANMIGDIADRTPGADKFEILRAVGADTRVGNKYLRPGYGFGGPCFPRDNRALGTFAKSKGVDPKIPVATDEYNNFHAEVMIQALLDQNLDKYVFTYIAYKEKCQVPIIEESQKLVLARALALKGKKVLIRDIPELVQCVQHRFGSLFEYEIVEPEK
eukprot:TRINITY_DN3732_c0_g2_i1.p1 TRINITY_DN3732_c0_g2~~TRINITY_DN3732_c0_g2_i1.p1  ORF type:complete len:377 (+),score=127.01 TRINITY_DN3732_c0_g2_i1:158-1288(+)